MSSGVEPERTGWRDQSLSERHREWGLRCPAVDIDFLMIEYNFGTPLGLVEYKSFLGKIPSRDHSTILALGKLANGYKDGAIPFFIAQYWPDTWAFRIYPMNESAERLFSAGERLTEKMYVERLYALRKSIMPDNVYARLHEQLPPV